MADWFGIHLTPHRRSKNLHFKTDLIPIASLGGG